MCYNLLAVPAVGNVDDTAVATHIVVLYRHGRRLLVEMSSPRKACIDILRYSKQFFLCCAVYFEREQLPFILGSLDDEPMPSFRLFKKA